MVFNTGAALLDAIVLAVVSMDEDGTYGYKITQDVRQAIDISEHIRIHSVSGSSQTSAGRMPGSLRPGVRRTQPALL